ncbi:MAG: hypothetical protein MJ124_02415 [Lachnospiraceae bacterium]|nr:hypothetical protein [Lachnospiraceae bacterium]
MKRKVIALMLALLMILAACGSPTGKINDKVVGSWAFNHDDTTEFAEFRDDGTAVYDGKKYTYTTDDTFIILKDKNGSETKLRYEMTQKGMNLCRIQTYVRMDGSDGIVGYWLDEINSWTFEFTEAGTFREDGAFTGHYATGSNGELKLMYERSFEDTLCYYTIEGDKIIIEYPWPMVKTAK